MSEAVLHINDADFETVVLKAVEPILVDFWAPWCGPCKAIGPILDEVATEYTGRLKIVKINVDDNHDVAARYGVRGIPTLILFVEGEAVQTKVGGLSKAQLTAWLDEAL